VEKVPWPGGCKDYIVRIKFSPSLHIDENENFKVQLNLACEVGLHNKKIIKKLLLKRPLLEDARDNAYCAIHKLNLFGFTISFA